MISAILLEEDGIQVLASTNGLRKKARGLLIQSLPELGRGKVANKAVSQVMPDNQIASLGWSVANKCERVKAKRCNLSV